MVFLAECSRVELVRPGRNLFVRQLDISAATAPPDSDNKGNTLEQQQQQQLDENDYAAVPEIQLIFQHGTCGTEQQFQPLLEALNGQVALRRMRCLLYDCLCCGQSPLSNEHGEHGCTYDRDAFLNVELAADLSALLDKYMDPIIPAVWIGHSYGPSIMLHVLQERSIPNLVGFVWLASAVQDPKFFPLANGGHPIMRLPVWMLKCLQPILTNSFIQMAVHPEHVKLQEQVRQASNGNDMTVAKYYHRNMHWATEKSLLKIRELPSLIVHGESDGLIPVECAQYLANVSPNSKLVVVEQASHLVMIEQPERVARELLAFLVERLGEVEKVRKQHGS